MRDRKQLSREEIERHVRRIREVMARRASRMVDMSHTAGTLRSFETSQGTVQALAYGFENPQVQPLLVNLHGSGFALGSAAMDDPFMMQFVEECGVKVLNVDYPLAPEAQFPEALFQCYALVRHAREHADELRCDPDRIMLMGHSAGGNLCIGIALMEGDRPTLDLKGIILDYPPCDLATNPYLKPLPLGCLPPRLCRLFDAAYCSEEERTHPLVSPIFATPDMVSHFPPVLLITAGQDSLASEAEHFAYTLRQANVSVSARRFEGAFHGFTIMTKEQGKRHPKRYFQSLEAWRMMREFVSAHI